jgi:hypothetical protein
MSHAWVWVTVGVLTLVLTCVVIWNATWVNTKPHITYVAYQPDRQEGAYPVDAVYTWVNPADETWQKAYAIATGKSDTSKRRFNNNSRLAADAELQTSMELLLKHCPWVRTVYVATMRPQVPPFLVKPEFRSLVDSGRVKVVHHDEFFEHPDTLPVFSSRPIEGNLHRIPGLSKQWLYLNDDMMTGKPVQKNMLFHDGKPVIRGLWMPVHHLGLRLDAHVSGCANNGKLMRCLWYFHNDHTTAPVDSAVMAAAAEWARGADESWERTMRSKLRGDDQLVPMGLAENLALDAGAYVCFRKSPLKTYAMLSSLLPWSKRQFVQKLPRYHFFCINNIPADDLMPTLAAVRDALGLAPLGP